MVLLFQSNADLITWIQAVEEKDYLLMMGYFFLRVPQASVGKKVLKEDR